MTGTGKSWWKFWRNLLSGDEGTDIPVFEEGTEIIEPDVSDNLYERFNLNTYEQIRIFDPTISQDLGDENILYVLNPETKYSETDFQEISHLLEHNDVLADDKQYKGLAYHATRRDYDFEGPRDTQTEWGEVQNSWGKYKHVSISNYSK